ncbi:60S ribosomal protein L13-1-like [Solanum tuberosum]|uniref:60S ribosomal protein L13-1-like n=1 Tax=Solanum tuberosum TaxID=4113 RepID=UPI00073A2FF5|nr:PREDICTED: 60S ribosomal protein L13-1-like [Solanum tuberosum]
MDICVKTWFNQPARKQRRIQGKSWLRRFSPDQLLELFALLSMAAGIPKKLASTIGIVVDHRCRNLSLEGLQADVLKTYKVGDSALSRDWLQQLKFMVPTCLLRVRSHL